MATIRFATFIAMICAFRVPQIQGQAECFNPFYQPPYCYGFGYNPYSFGAGFGFPGFGAGAGGFAGGSAGFGGFGGGAGGFSGFGGPRYGSGFGGFGGFGPGFNPYIPSSVSSSGPGFHTTSGTSSFTYGPDGRIQQTSQSNQLVTTQADDGTWTIQSSGFPMDTSVEGGTIRVIGSVGKPTKVDREVVSAHEIQINFSYKDEPKKWINLKTDAKGPNVAGVTIDQKGDQVYIHGPRGHKSHQQRRGYNYRK